MKQKIIFNDNISGKTTITYVEVRRPDHLLAQQTHKASVIKPKKGKGSFTRKGRKKNIEEY